MALNPKKAAFALDMEERLNRPHADAHTHTDGHTDADTHAHTYTDIETKSKRLYLLAKPSVHEKLDRYAKAHNDSFNNLVHTLMEQFIKDNNL